MVTEAVECPTCGEPEINLTPLLPFWEKGLGDEGNLDFA